MDVVKEWADLALKIFNIIIILYGGYKFLGKPRESLEKRIRELTGEVNDLKSEIKTIKESLHQGNDQFREQHKTNATFKSVMLAFIDFEIAYCLHTNYEFTDDLMKAKKELQDYVSGK